MDTFNFPKVLLMINFDQKSANGITINNLFSQWPKNKIAVADTNANNIQTIFVPNIRSYFIFGKDEIQFSKPFNVIKKFGKSHSYELQQLPKADTNYNIKKTNFIKSSLTKAQHTFLDKTGFVLTSKKYKISPALDGWIKSFNPDCIYVSMSDISKMDFFATLQNIYKVPVIVHFFDDFVNSRFERTTFKKFWKKKLEYSFLNLLNNSSLHLSISEKMSLEYNKKYGFKFHSFHNPVDLHFWNREKSSKMEKNPFTFIYAGKVNRDTNQAISEFYLAIKKIQMGGLNVSFKLYSPYKFEEIHLFLGDIADEIYAGNVPYAELPDVFSNADGLLLPLNNTKETKKYIRLSMLTKATEYMVSKTPIFIYATNDIAVSEYLTENNSAFICSESGDKLVDSIKSFILDSGMRKEISEKAYSIVISRHTKENVSDRLKKLIIKTISNN